MRSVQPKKTSAGFILITGKGAQTSFTQWWVRILFIYERCTFCNQNCHLKSVYGERTLHGRLKVLSKERQCSVTCILNCQEVRCGGCFCGVPTGASQEPRRPLIVRNCPGNTVLLVKSGSWGRIRFSGFLRSPEVREYLEPSQGNGTRGNNSVSCLLTAATSHLFNIYALFLSLY